MGDLAKDQHIEQRPASRSVKLFLADGSPHGIVVTDVGNWNGKVLAGPRSRLPELLKRPEASRTGVYGRQIGTHSVPVQPGAAG